MNTYQDNMTMWHDKPCTDGNPSSNNAWIYTAYARHLAKDTVSHEHMLIRFNECVTNYAPLRFDRLPGKKHPPVSKDEIIGAVSLGLITPKELEFNHWNFCNLENYMPKKLTLSGIYKAIKVIKSAQGQHRNYIWQNSLTDAYCLTFLLPPEDQYYVKKLHGERAGIFRTIIFYINTYLTLTGDNKSAKMLKWLQLEDLKHPLLRFVNKNKFVTEYFGLDHPFTKGLE